MIWPKISIVTPSYNHGAFLEDTICSVLDQKYPNLEYIIIDGGSSDGSLDIIKRYAKHLHYWESEKDNGHAHALNKGFSHATGDIMAWQNSDDKYTPWSFSIVGEIFTQCPEVRWLCGFPGLWDVKGRLSTIDTLNPKLNVYNYLTGKYKWIPQDSVFWRRTLWNKAGGFLDESYPLMCDGELWTRFFLHEKLYYVHASLSGYRVHGTNRAMLNRKACDADMARAIAKLKQNLPREILDTYKKMPWHYQPKVADYFCFFFNKRLYQKLFLPESVLTYPVVIYEGNKWIACPLNQTR